MSPSTLLSCQAFVTLDTCAHAYTHTCSGRQCVGVTDSGFW